MKTYDKGSRVRAALAKHVRRQKNSVANASANNRVSSQYEYNYLARTLERMDTEFGNFCTDQVAYERGMATLLADAQRTVRAYSCQQGTRRAATHVKSLLEQFS